jgi:hypothetical protein
MAKIRAHRATVALREAHLRRERAFTVLEGGGRDEEEVPS